MDNLLSDALSIVMIFCIGCTLWTVFKLDRRPHEGGPAASQLENSRPALAINNGSAVDGWPNCSDEKRHHDLIQINSRYTELGFAKF